MSAIPATEELKREIGVRSLALAIVNMVIGSGIFALPAIVADGLGATAIVAYISCGVLIFLLALCFAEAGSKISKSGGGYTYIEEAFGPYPGFLASSIYLLGGCMASDAAIANAMADTLQSFFPELSIDTNRILFMLILFGGLGWLNIISARNGLRIVVFSSMIKLTALILLVIVAIPHVSKENLSWVIPPSFSNIGPATLLLFFAFQGFEVPLSNGGEIRAPSRTVPMGIFLGVSIVLVMYMSIQWVTQGMLGNNLSAHKNAPLAAVASVAFGRPGMVLIIVVTILSILGALSGSVLSLPRILFASARDGLLPRSLAKVHPRFVTPHVAIMVYVAIDFIMAISGGFKELAILSSAAALLLYSGVVLASIRLRSKKGYADKKGFRTPGGITVPAVAIMAVIWLLSQLSRAELTGIFVSIGVFSVIYFIITILKRGE